MHNTHTHTHTKAPVTFHHRSFRRPSVNDPMPVSCVFLFLCGCPCLCMFSFSFLLLLFSNLFVFDHHWVFFYVFHLLRKPSEVDCAVYFCASTSGLDTVAWAQPYSQVSNMFWHTPFRHTHTHSHTWWSIGSVSTKHRTVSFFSMFCSRFTPTTVSNDNLN